MTLPSVERHAEILAVADHMPDAAFQSQPSFNEALNGLRIAIDRQSASVDISADVRAQVVSICSLARAARIEPERVLVRVKGTLQQSARLSSIDPGWRSQILARVISLTIASYFAND